MHLDGKDWKGVDVCIFIETPNLQSPFFFFDSKCLEKIIPCQFGTLNGLARKLFQRSFPRDTVVSGPPAAETCGSLVDPPKTKFKNNNTPKSPREWRILKSHEILSMLHVRVGPPPNKSAAPELATYRRNPLAHPQLAIAAAWKMQLLQLVSLGFRIPTKKKKKRKQNNGVSPKI